jgi:hypothetical protein
MLFGDLENGLSRFEGKYRTVDTYRALLHGLLLSLGVAGVFIAGGRNADLYVMDDIT